MPLIIVIGESHFAQRHRTLLAGNRGVFFSIRFKLARSLILRQIQCVGDFLLTLNQLGEFVRVFKWQRCLGGEFRNALLLVFNRPLQVGDFFFELIQRQQEIADALDLTKNQASSQLESEADDDSTVASEQGAVALREMGFPDYDD